jgi:uncharacterized protein
VVKAGDIVRVRVVEVDVARKRIGLSMRKDDGAAVLRQPKASAQETRQAARHAGSKPASRPEESGSLGAALLDALRKKGEPR